MKRGWLALAALVLGWPARAQIVCHAVSFEGDVAAGQAFRREFTPGLELFLEPLPSGWIVRVLPVRDGMEVRSMAHDWAEVATPPFRSVSPLLISTDWAFRAQDAVAWNPREFRYAADAATFDRLSRLEDRVLANDAAADAPDAELAAAQPEVQLTILDAAYAPGTRDQAGMAAPVAVHLDETPHEIVQGEKATPLGRLERLRFRVTLELPPRAKAAPKLSAERFSCALRPTT